MSRALCLSFLDVGQGDATLIVPPEGEGDTVVFDCADGWVVAQQLAVWGIDRVAAIVVSHLDLDHLAGLADLLDAHARGTLRIAVVYFPIDRDLSTEEGSDQAKGLADRLRAGEQEGNWELRAVQRDARAVLEGEDWSIHLAAPRYGASLEAQRRARWEDANSYSAVLSARMKDNVVLVGGDAPLTTWASLPPIERSNVSVFRIPHHGGALGDDATRVADLYAELAPKTATLSVGTSNRHDHPDPRWIEPACHGKCRLVCTQVTGRCHAAFARATDPQSKKRRDDVVQRERERELPAPAADTSAHFAEPPWRHYTSRRDGKLLTRVADRPEVPCAGTISVRLDDAGFVRVDPSPTHASLLARIDRWDHPLCQDESATTLPGA